MQATLDYELTDELLRVAILRHYVRTQRKLIIYFVVLVTLTFAVMAPAGLGTALLFLASVVVAVSLGIYVGYRIQLRQNLSYFEKLPSRKVSCRVSERGIEVTEPLGRAELPWQMFEKLWRFSDVWLLFHRKQQFHILPTAQLSADLADFITQKVLEHGGTVR